MTSAIERRLARIESKTDNAYPFVFRLPIGCTDEEAERLTAEAERTAGGRPVVAIRRRII